MPTYDWTGLGLADNTVLSNANLNTTGNGTGTLTFIALSGTSPVRVTQQSADGNGVSISGSATALARLDTSAIAGGAECMAVTFRYKAPATPTTGHNYLAVARNVATPTKATSAQVCHTITTNRLEFRDTTDTLATSAVSGSATTGQTPALVAGDVYRVDMAVIRYTSGTPTTSNGRILGRVQAITTPTWNSSVEFWFDTGYTANTTIEKTDVFRVGKCATPGAVESFDFLNLKWRDLATPNTSLTKANAITNFVSDSAPTVNTLGTGGGYAIVEVGTAAAGGSLTYTITQTSGTTHTPVATAANGVWTVTQDTSAATGYDILVEEAGGGSVTTSIVVPATTTSALGGQFRRRRQVAGVMV